MIGVACTAAIALSSCSTTTDGTGTPGSGTAAKGGPAATPTDSASLGAALRSGAASMSSARSCTTGDAESSLLAVRLSIKVEGMTI